MEIGNLSEILAKLWGRCSLTDPRAEGMRRGWNWCSHGDSNICFHQILESLIKGGNRHRFSKPPHSGISLFNLSWKWDISSSVLQLHRSGFSLPGLTTGLQHLLSLASFLGFFINAENFAKTSFPAEFDSGCFGASLGYLSSSEKQKEVTQLSFVSTNKYTFIFRVTTYSHTGLKGNHP